MTVGVGRPGTFGVVTVRAEALGRAAMPITTSVVIATTTSFRLRHTVVNPLRQVCSRMRTRLDLLENLGLGLPVPAARSRFALSRSDHLSYVAIERLPRAPVLRTSPGHSSEAKLVWAMCRRKRGSGGPGGGRHCVFALGAGARGQQDVQQRVQIDVSLRGEGDREAGLDRVAVASAHPLAVEVTGVD